MIGAESLDGLLEAIGFWQTAEDELIRIFLDDLGHHGGANPIATPRAFRRWATTALGDAEPFYVSAEMTALIEHAADSVPPLSLTSDYLPVPNGWLWFSTPLSHPPTPPIPIQAIHWFPQLADDGLIGIVIHAYGRYQGRIMFDGLSTLKLGEELGADDAPDQQSITRVERVLAAFYLFIQQEIVTTARQQVSNRGARRRLAQALGRDDPAWRTVELRRLVHEGTPNERSVEWQHSWLVSGHWRRQFYPKSGTHTPKWIAPYIKGDPSLPLKPTTRRLFLVRR